MEDLATLESKSLKELREIAKALDLPGIPIRSLYVGCNVFTSNSHDAFSTPSVVSANILSSL